MSTSKKTMARFERVKMALKLIYGPGIPTFPGSPYENTKRDEVEIVLHELAHQTLMPKSMVFPPGKMEPEFNTVGDYLDTLPKYLADWHEIRAIAIELLVAGKLGLNLEPYWIIRGSKFNTALYKSHPDIDHYFKLIERAMELQSVIFRAATILVYVEERMENL